MPARLRRLRVRRTRPRSTRSGGFTIWPAVIIIGFIVFVILTRLRILDL